MLSAGLAANGGRVVVAAAPARCRVPCIVALLLTSPGRAQDLVTAVHEVAANTVVHAGGAGVLRTWRDGLSLVCEIADDGQITDPLAGRHPDSPDDDSGHGLRIAHELCDLVQVRSGPWGTTVRLPMLVR